MSKKGLFFDMITGVQSMVLLVVILVLFGIAFISLSAESSIQQNKMLPTEDLRLLNYLKTPLAVNNVQTTLGDFIISSNLDLEKRSLIEPEINKIALISLDLEDNNNIDIIKIIFPDKSEIKSVEFLDEEDLKVGAVYLPTFNPEEAIIVELYKHEI